ncbi:MAG: hypothetical protein OK454_04520 [Thaumarchaeota archaeon]|nr:hypothetical protein [Nitrososphaerota archaeon]
MTKHDQLVVAKIIRGQAPRRSRKLKAVAWALADFLEAQSPSFDRDRFLIGCGVKRPQKGP